RLGLAGAAVPGRSAAGAAGGHPPEIPARPKLSRDRRSPEPDRHQRRVPDSYGNQDPAPAPGGQRRRSPGQKLNKKQSRLMSSENVDGSEQQLTAYALEEL